MKIRFKKGIKTIHVPFHPEMGSYNQLYREINKCKFPKSTRRIEASLVVSIDLKEGATSYELAEVTLMK